MRCDAILYYTILAAISNVFIYIEMIVLLVLVMVLVITVGFCCIYFYLLIFLLPFSLSKSREGASLSSQGVDPGYRMRGDGLWGECVPIPPSFPLYLSFLL